MSNIDKQALRLTAEKAKDNFMPNFMVPTRDVLALLDELEASDALNKHLDLAIRKAEGCSEALRRRAEAAEKRIAELEERNAEILRQARSFREAHESASEIIRRMERSKPVVILPTTRLWAGKVPCFEEKEIISLLEAAGIITKVGE